MKLNQLIGRTIGDLYFLQDLLAEESNHYAIEEGDSITVTIELWQRYLNKMGDCIEFLPDVPEIKKENS